MLTAKLEDCVYCDVLSYVLALVFKVKHKIAGPQPTDTPRLLICVRT